MDFTETLNLCNFAKQNYLQMLSTVLLTRVITFLVMAIIQIKTYISASLPYYNLGYPVSFQVETADNVSV